MIEEEAMAYLPGFAWAVPRAFASAVASYRFEQGDVLHRDRRGYAALTGGLPTGLTALQLRQPPRSARALPTEFDGDRRLANWQSEVELELVDLAAGTVELRSTTQGRLFMALWRGDEDALRGGGENPPLPRSARELAQALREGQLDLPMPVHGGRGCRFCFVVDLSNDASRAKAAAIADALSSLGRVDPTDRDPVAAGARAGAEFHPTLVVRELVLDAAADTVEVLLKRALYSGSSSIGISRGVGTGIDRGETERFSVARHGVLEDLQPTTGA